MARVGTARNTESMIRAGVSGQISSSASRKKKRSSGSSSPTKEQIAETEKVLAEDARKKAAEAAKSSADNKEKLQAQQAAEKLRQFRADSSAYVIDKRTARVRAAQQFQQQSNRKQTQPIAIQAEQPVYAEITEQGLSKDILIKKDGAFTKTGYELRSDALQQLNTDNIRRQIVAAKNVPVLNEPTRKIVSATIPTTQQTDISVIPKTNIFIKPEKELPVIPSVIGTDLRTAYMNVPVRRDAPTLFESYKATADRGLSRIEFFTQSQSTQAIQSFKSGDIRGGLRSATLSAGSGFAGFFASIGLGLTTRPKETLLSFAAPLLTPDKFISSTISRAKSTPFGFAGEVGGMVVLGKGLSGTPAVAKSVTKPIRSALFERRISRGTGDILKVDYAESFLYDGQTQLVPKTRASIIGDVRSASKSSLRVGDIEILAGEKLFRFGDSKQTTLAPKTIEFVKLEGGGIIGRFVPTQADLLKIAQSRLPRTPKTPEVQTTLIREPFLTFKKTPKGTEIKINQPLFATPLGGLEFYTAQAAGKAFDFIRSPEAKQAATLVGETIRAKAPRPVLVLKGSVSLEKSLIREGLKEDQKIKTYPILLTRTKTDSKLAVDYLSLRKEATKDKIIPLIDVQSKSKSKSKIIEITKPISDTLPDIKPKPPIETPDYTFKSSSSRLRELVEPPLKVRPTKAPTINLIKTKPIPRSTLQKAFDVFVKSKGTYKAVGVGLTRGAALSLGARVTKGSLAASFKVRAGKGFAKVGGNGGYFSSVKSQFRTFKKVKGRKVKLEDEFIQLRKFRLGTRSEVGAIQKARKRSSPFLKGKVGGIL